MTHSHLKHTTDRTALGRMLRLGGAWLFCAGALVAADPGSARESIVGTWATPGRCGVPLATVTVEPKRFLGEDFHCDFNAVSRQGDTVRWRGHCVFGADPPRPAQVVARLQGGGLSYRIGADGWSGLLQRCGRAAR